VESREKDDAVIPRCYECGRPVFSKRELVYHHVGFSEASLWGGQQERNSIRPRSFHLMCWQSRRHRERAGWIIALGILLALVLGPVLVNLLG